MQTTETTAAVPRVVDCHSLFHLQAPKATKSVDAADACDGLVVLQNPTVRLAATAYGVSLGSVARARRLTPEQRDAVRQGKRPLVLPRTPAASPAPTVVPATPSVPPVIADAQQQLAYLVAEIGLNTVIDLLAANEKVAA